MYEYVYEHTNNHSLIVDRNTLPGCLKISAWSDQVEIMGIRHRDYPVEGAQFHTESILTEQGSRLINNFFKSTPIKGGRENGN